jgi:hypothetical protein
MISYNYQRVPLQMDLIRNRTFPEWGAGESEVGAGNLSNLLELH